MATQLTRKSFLWGVVSLIAVLLIGIGVAHRHGGWGDGELIRDPGNNISDYSAVFFSNSQVFFGKLYSDGPDRVELRDVYYLQVNQSLQNTDTSANNGSGIVILRLGNELHGPNNIMHINRSQIQFTESLKNDSKVLDAIKHYKS